MPPSSMVGLGLMGLAGDAKSNYNKEKSHCYKVGSLLDRVINYPSFPGSEKVPGVHES